MFQVNSHLGENFIFHFDLELSYHKVKRFPYCHQQILKNRTTARYGPPCLLSIVFGIKNTSQLRTKSFFSPKKL